MINKKHVVLTIVFIIFIFPVVGGSLLYQFRHHFSFKTVNHGVLLKTPFDATFLYADNQKKWRVIYIADGMCDAQCQHTDFMLHQMQKVLGKNQNRVQVLQLNPNATGVSILQTKLGQAVGNKIYLIDPLGNLFMYYAATENPMNILKDLKRVLEVSQIG